MAQSFARGTLTLTVGNIFTRTVGLVYRVLLVRLAGAEVIGLFQMVFPAYFTLVVLASAGLPLAVSKMVADRDTPARRHEIPEVMRTALRWTASFGTVVTVILFASAGLLSYKVLGDGRTFMALLVIAPGLPAIAVTGTLKGYFQGLAEMRPVAGSQVVEQLVHVGVTLALVEAYRTGSPQLVSALLAAGSLAGDLGGFAFMGVAYRAACGRRTPARPRASTRARVGPSIPRELAMLAAPVMVGRLAVSLNSAINASLVPNLLKAGGLGRHDATVAFAALTGMAMNLLTMPTVFTTSMASGLVSAVAAARVRGNDARVEATTWRALKGSLLVGAYCSGLFVALGRPLCDALFGSPMAGTLLMIMAPGGVAIYAQHVLAGCLQGLNRPIIPTVCTVIATAFSTVGLLVFVGRLQMGIAGAAWAISIAMLLGAWLCLVATQRLAKLRPITPTALRCLIAGAAEGVAAWALFGNAQWGHAGSAARLAVALPGATVVFGLCAVALGLVSVSGSWRRRLGH